MAGPNEQAVRELYTDDPFTDSAWFGTMLEEARESDRIAALWAERAEDEADELGEPEEVDQ